MRNRPEILEEDGLLPDARVEALVGQLTRVQRTFLAGLGRGLDPADAARRAGWRPGDAERIAAVYMTEHSVVQPLADHILRLRRLALMEDLETVPGSPVPIH